MGLYAEEERPVCSSVFPEKERSPKTQKGDIAMDWSTIADWFTILFFLWFGLKYFIPTLDKGLFQTVGAFLALATAISTILDRSA
jgi:hypothetical protein